MADNYILVKREKMEISISTHQLSMTRKNNGEQNLYHSSRTQQYCLPKIDRIVQLIPLLCWLPEMATEPYEHPTQLT